MEMKFAAAFAFMMTAFVSANASLPSLANASRFLPPEVGESVSMLSGDTCLIRASNPWPEGNLIEKCYVFRNGQWLLDPDHLPFSHWPRLSYDGMLSFYIPPAGNGDSSRTIVEANSGEILWEGLPNRGIEAFSRDFHVSFQSGSVTVRDRAGNVTTRPHLFFSEPSGALVSGNEVAFTQSVPEGTRVVRQDLVSGAVLDQWGPGVGNTIAAFRAGTVLTTNRFNTAAPIRVLAPGRADPIPIRIPPGYLPGGKPLLISSSGRFNPISGSNTGVWIETDHKTYHFYVLEDGNARCDHLLTGRELIVADGTRVAVRDFGSAPVLVDGSPAAPPVLGFGEARGRELSGKVDVTVVLDRPSPTPVTVRVATRSGGSASLDDFHPADHWITIAPGELAGTFTFGVKPDQIPECHETVLVEILEASGADFLPGTSAAAIIEASGVERIFNPTPPVLINWPRPPGDTVTGGDGLIYRITGRRTRDPWIEVVDPPTGAILETMAVSGLRPGSNSQHYEPAIVATERGAQCIFQEGGIHQTWDFRARRDRAAVDISVCSPVEGGIDGFIEFRLREAAAAPVDFEWEWAVVARADLWPGANYNPVLPTSGTVTMPADGSVARVPIGLRSERSSERRMPLRLSVKPLDGAVSRIVLIEPGPAGFRTPVGAPVTGDPFLRPDSLIGAIRTVGDLLYVGRPKALDLQGTPKPCIEVHDAFTGDYLRTIHAPPSLTHEGFGTAIYGDNRDLFVFAADVPDVPDPKPKIYAQYRSLLVFDAVTGSLKATLKGPYENFGEIVRFSPDYLAICAPSTFDPVVRGSKVPGAVMVFRRSDYKLAGTFKLAGNDAGTSMEIIGQKLYLGMPALVWINRNRNLPRPEKWEYAGGVLGFDLPKMKKPGVFVSPSGPRQGGGFGFYMARDAGGDLLVSEGSTIHRFDPTGPRPPVIEDTSLNRLPLFDYEEDNGLRLTRAETLYDVASRTPLTELMDIGAAHFGRGILITQDFRSPTTLMAVSPAFCGNFDLWARLRRDGHTITDPSVDADGNGRAELEDYLVEQIGALPGVEVDFSDYYQDLRKIRFRAMADLPPDVAMLVESSYSGGPWKLAALKRGGGPLLNANGWKPDAAGWTLPTDDPVDPQEIRTRVSFIHSQALVLGEDEFRVTLFE